MGEDSVESGVVTRERNRRVGLVLVMALAALYGLAIVGVIVLN
jgi:hypothetical protein